MQDQDIIEDLMDLTLDQAKVITDLRNEVHNLKLLLVLKETKVAEITEESGNTFSHKQKNFNPFAVLPKLK